ncbi:MAG: AAA family ATPase [Bacillota bacterium]
MTETAPMSVNEETALIDALEGIIKRTAPDADAIRDVVQQVVDERLPRVVEVHEGECKLGNVDGWVRPEYETITKAVATGENTMLFGPAGCGKTHLCGQIAQGLGIRFAFCSLTAGITESRLVGRFIPLGAHGEFKYCPAQFVDFYKNGGLFLLDEMDAADPNVLLAINAALANGHMETPNPEEPVIYRHKDFHCMAAANTWGHGADRMYVGRNQLDAASLDRFQVRFALDYDAEFEKRVGHPDVVAFIHDTRAKIRSHSIRRLASTRPVLSYTKLMSAGFTLKDVMEMYFLPWSDNEKALLA